MGVDAMSVEDLKKLNKNKKLVKKLGVPYCVACSGSDGTSAASVHSSSHCAGSSTNGA